MKTYIVAGSRQNAPKYDASPYNLNVNQYTYEGLIDFLSNMNNEDPF